LLKYEGSLDRYIQKPGDLVGAIINMGKSVLASEYTKVEEK